MTKVNWTARKLIATGAWTVCAISLTLHGANSADVHADLAKSASIEADATARAERFIAYHREAVRVADATTVAPALKPAPSAAKFVAVETAAAQVARLAPVSFDIAPLAATLRSERNCLADAIYHEARGESVAGQLAVADVILNRKASEYYPDTICGVVYQGSHRVTGCQFSFTCDGSLNRRLNAVKRREAEDMADAVLAGLRAPLSREATHYHADYVDPTWAKRLTPTAQIGAHKFYRFPSKIVLAAAPGSF